MCVVSPPVSAISVTLFKGCPKLTAGRQGSCRAPPSSMCKKTLEGDLLPDLLLFQFSSFSSPLLTERISSFQEREVGRLKSRVSFHGFCFSTRERGASSSVFSFHEVGGGFFITAPSRRFYLPARNTIYNVHTSPPELTVLLFSLPIPVIEEGKYSVRLDAMAMVSCYQRPKKGKCTGTFPTPIPETTAFHIKLHFHP